MQKIYNMQRAAHIAMGYLAKKWITRREAMAKATVHGSGLTAYGIYLLAQSYHVAGDRLADFQDQYSRFSDHPRRLLYFQALENYLRSFLRLHGKEPEEIRRYDHNFSAMLDDSRIFGLHIKGRTEKFIRESGDRRDYVRVRYDYDLRVLDDPALRRPPALAQLANAVINLELPVRMALAATGIEIVPTAER
ncbi:hypothetical protein [Mesorhizobium sp. M7A.F.Ca.US.010.02.1.1]|uniref:hypothetical protein n=1 Tax=Mesorhizobium sp. M7A.F.Ca.US.010.02.1.1 TaxID=2496743 RepID=UPI000FD3C423|nr:hypothetical protein [Mesorhizobium sp. M7A.F.Ca.US.010.02.1.1]RUW94412.1 hypothetical protein EOA19_03460 [Mesorhizobium sp. M7A.F.Ca.US.010.02.1.1]